MGTFLFQPQARLVGVWGEGGKWSRSTISYPKPWEEVAGDRKGWGGGKKAEKNCLTLPKRASPPVGEGGSRGRRGQGAGQTGWPREGTQKCSEAGGVGDAPKWGSGRSSAKSEKLSG